ncbi:alkaline phosphatase [Rhodococcus ruber]|nr:alkaline phosphatase [Rhodococcus ruber]
MPPTEPRAVSRRTALRAGGAVLGAAALAAVCASPASAQNSVFAHGVASGDPLPDRVILWTRVTPAPDAVPGSGLGAATAVRWEVATDGDFRDVVASGSVTTSPVSDHTVKVDATGLEPDTAYVYRFTAGDVSSPVGRTRTAPGPDTDPDRLRFAVVSCSNWEAGFFGVYRHLAARPDLDAVVHLGDYLYEYGTGEYAAGDRVVRPHDPRHEIVTLADYRIRHGQYKSDPDLQRLHALVPWIVVWDDHESANDAWSGGAENHDPAVEGIWADRRAAALQAYLEWQPVRPGGTTDAPRLYRRLQFGSLAELSMLDLRSYRSEQVNGRRLDDPERTITGAEQMAWLTAGVASSGTRWQLVGNPVMIAPVLLPPLDERTTAALTAVAGIPAAGAPFNVDQWDGYPADRRRLLDAIRASGRDVVFLTGDIHSSWAADIPVDAANYPGAGTVATELVVPSVTSANIDELLGVAPRTVSPSIEAAVQATNRHIGYVELDSHGFGILDVTADAVQMDWFYVLDPTDPGTGARYGTSRRVAAGTPRLAPAGPLDPGAHRRADRP